MSGQRCCPLQLRSLHCLQHADGSVRIGQVLQEACPRRLVGTTCQLWLGSQVGLVRLRDDSERGLGRLELRNDTLRGHGTREDTTLHHLLQRLLRHGVLVGRQAASVASILDRGLSVHCPMTMGMLARIEVVELQALP